MREMAAGWASPESDAPGGHIRPPCESFVRRIPHVLSTYVMDCMRAARHQYGQLILVDSFRAIVGDPSIANQATGCGRWLRRQRLGRYRCMVGSYSSRAA